MATKVSDSTATAILFFLKNIHLVAKVALEKGFPDMYGSRGVLTGGKKVMHRQSWAVSGFRQTYEMLFFRKPKIFFEGTYPPMTNTCLKSYSLGLLEYTPHTSPPIGHPAAPIEGILGGICKNAPRWQECWRHKEMCIMFLSVPLAHGPELR